MGKTFRGYISEGEKTFAPEELLNGVEWITSSRQINTSGEADVTIGKIQKGTSIIFRNGIPEKIGERVAIAIKGNTVFFKVDPKGWKISIRNRAKSFGYIQISKSQIELADFIGDYELHYFEALNIWYIQKEKK